MITQIRAALAGKKTHITGWLIGLLMFGNWQHWWQVPPEAYAILVPLAISFLRAGISREIRELTDAATAPDLAQEVGTAPASRPAAAPSPSGPTAGRLALGIGAVVLGLGMWLGLCLLCGGCATKQTVVTPPQTIVTETTNAAGTVTSQTNTIPGSTNVITVPVSANPLIGTNGVLTQVFGALITTAIITEGGAVISRSPQHAAGIKADLQAIADALRGTSSVADATAVMQGLKLQSAEVTAFIPTIVALLNLGEQEAALHGATSGYFGDLQTALINGLVALGSH